jgi:hypothetical protein
MGLPGSRAGTGGTGETRVVCRLAGVKDRLKPDVLSETSMLLASCVQRLPHRQPRRRRSAPAKR